MGKYGDSEQVKVVKRLIEAFPTRDRAMLAPWLLAKYDVRGYPQVGTTDHQREEREKL